jgi:hypothetical protein
VIKRTVLLSAIALLVVGAAGAGGPKRSIAITGTSESAGVVTVKVKITGWKMHPALIGAKANRKDGGHWHIFVDGTYDSGWGTVTGTTRKLDAGKHALYVELVNNDHSSLTPPVRSRAVSVAVAATPGDSGGTPSDPGYGSDPYGP